MDVFDYCRIVSSLLFFLFSFASFQALLTRIYFEALSCLCRSMISEKGREGKRWRKNRILTLSLTAPGWREKQTVDAARKVAEGRERKIAAIGYHGKSS